MIEYESKIANQHRYLPNFNINNSQFYSINFDIIEPRIVLQKAILVITNSNH